MHVFRHADFNDLEIYGGFAFRPKYGWNRQTLFFFVKSNFCLKSNFWRCRLKCEIERFALQTAKARSELEQSSLRRCPAPFVVRSDRVKPVLGGAPGAQGRLIAPPASLQHGVERSNEALSELSNNSGVGNTHTDEETPRRDRGVHQGVPEPPPMTRDSGWPILIVTTVLAATAAVAPPSQQHSSGCPR